MSAWIISVLLIAFGVSGVVYGATVTWGLLFADAGFVRRARGQVLGMPRRFRWLRRTRYPVVVPFMGICLLALGLSTVLPRAWEVGHAFLRVTAVVAVACGTVGFVWPYRFLPRWIREQEDAARRSPRDIWQP